jgi:sec-independent protein translocase protein TatA
MDFGLPELIIILVILLLLFGSTRLPKLSRSIGQSAKELKEGFGDGSKSEKTAKQDSAPKNDKDKS